ncbi:MAG: putative cytosolic protein [bacterium 42_11]|nr:MAG: putative cytosolic protein [bacterium 42_11]
MKRNLLEDILGEIVIETPFFLRNLVIYPLKFPEIDVGGEFLTLEDDGFSVSELDPPTIERVRFTNLSGKPFFILDGEELLGARQDRVVNTSLWIGKMGDFEIPVSCIERRRWGGGTIFETGVVLLNPSLRRTLCEGVTGSLFRGEGYKSDQRALWDSVERTLASLKISSKTSSFNDVYATLRAEIEGYLEELQGLNGDFSGFVVETPTLISVDLFGSRKILAKFLKKLLRSYLIEGFLAKRGVNPSLRRVRSLIKPIIVKDVIEHSTPTGLGKEVRFGDGKKTIGKILVLGETFLHFSLFKVK